MIEQQGKREGGKEPPFAFNQPAERKDFFDTLKGFERRKFRTQS